MSEKHLRPSERDKCFYCSARLGEPHGEHCAIPRRKVRVRATIEVDVWVPLPWDAEMINFHFNESSWCADNFVDTLAQAVEENESSCLLCNSSSFKYLGEAGDELG
jgi:hypothetical protein